MRVQQAAVDEHVQVVAPVWTTSGVVLMLGVAGGCWREGMIPAPKEAAWSLRKLELGPLHRQQSVNEKMIFPASDQVESGLEVQ